MSELFDWNFVSHGLRECETIHHANRNNTHNDHQQGDVARSQTDLQKSQAASGKISIIQGFIQMKKNNNVMYWFMTERRLKQWAQHNEAQCDIWGAARCISAVHLSSPLCKTLCECHSVNTAQEVFATTNHSSRRVLSPTRRVIQLFGMMNGAKPLHPTVEGVCVKLVCWTHA